MDSMSNTHEGILPDTLSLSPNETFPSCSIAADPKFASLGFRDTYSVLRTAIPSTEEDRAFAKANILYAQSEGIVLDKQITLAQQHLSDLKRRRTAGGLERETDLSFTQFEDVRIDQEILRVQQDIEVLQSRRGALRCFEELEKGILASIRRIPVEILRHIFLLVHTESAENTFFSDNMNVFPRIAAQVCFYWRSVSHSCAPLWTNIFCAVTGKEAFIPKYGQPIEDCLHYSNGLPLVLCLIHRVTPEVLGDSCVEALGRCAPRWKTVLLFEANLVKAIFASIPKETSMDHLESLDIRNLDGPLTIAAAPKLRDLSIQGENSALEDVEDARIPNHVLVTIESAPSLVELALSSIYYPLITLNGLNWSTITEFTSDHNYFQTDELAILLEWMPSLVSLAFYGHTGTTSRCISLPCLETVMAGGLTPTRTSIFNLLIAPKLKKLDIEWGIVSMSSMVQCIRRSGCVIQEFELKNRVIDDSWRISEFHNIKTLKWDDPFLVENSIEQLLYDSTRYPDDMLPGLENLQIDMMTLWPRQDLSRSIVRLIDVLNSRLQPQDIGNPSRSYLKSLLLNITVVEDEHDALLTNFIQSELARCSGAQIEIRSYRSTSPTVSLLLKNF